MLKSLSNKIAGFKTRNFIKKRLQHRRFPVNIAKLSRKTFFIKHFWRLHLYFVFCDCVIVLFKTLSLKKCHFSEILKDRLQISLLILSEFKQIFQLLFSLISSESHRFLNDFRGNRS